MYLLSYKIKGNR